MKLPKMPSFRLDNKRALIVGSSSGIGIGCATALADAGASVVLAARRKDLLDDLKKIGFQAITYMPPRNSNNQLTRLKLLCKNLPFYLFYLLFVLLFSLSFRRPLIKASTYVLS